VCLFFLSVVLHLIFEVFKLVLAYENLLDSKFALLCIVRGQDKLMDCGNGLQS